MAVNMTTRLDRRKRHAATWRPGCPADSGGRGKTRFAAWGRQASFGKGRGKTRFAAWGRQASFGKARGEARGKALGIPDINAYLFRPCGHIVIYRSPAYVFVIAMPLQPSFRLAPESGVVHPRLR